MLKISNTLTFIETKKLPYGYYTSYSYMGFLNTIRGFMEFESEVAYLEYLEDHPEEES